MTAKRQLDSVNTPWVWAEQPDPKFAYQWRIVKFEFTPAVGNTLYVRTLDLDGTPVAGEYIYFIWPTIEVPDTAGGSPFVQQTDKDGWANMMIASIQRGQTPGPYGAMVRQTKKDAVTQYKDGWSEWFYGVGNHENRHDTYRLTFQRFDTSTNPPTPPPIPPPPTPPPGKTRFETALAALKASGGGPVPFTFNDETYYAAGNMDTGIIVRRPRDGAVWMMWPEEL